MKTNESECRADQQYIDLMRLGEGIPEREIRDRERLLKEKRATSSPIVDTLEQMIEAASSGKFCLPEGTAAVCLQPTGDGDYSPCLVLILPDENISRLARTRRGETAQTLEGAELHFFGRGDERVAPLEMALPNQLIQAPWNGREYLVKKPPTSPDALST
ncbi:MAG TPA: hypothetical protein VLE93_03445 [Candidatus Saccharimonadales bacterium]|nr:hypothetical protein [Candidatus Saccharimonadales bacterium]